MSQSRRDVNPFPGLRPFETEEYLLFFGREGQSDELLARLGRTRFLAVVGTSGSGKSSLVRAGLLPAMRGGLMAGAGSGWRVAVMRPGHDPVGNLALALAAEGVLAEAGAGLRGAEAEALIEATLRGGSLGLVHAARQARLGEHENLLVVVDQFEELFRFRAARAGGGDDAAAFVKLLLEAAAQREAAIYVVITMRSDFLGDCAQFQGLPEAINDGQYLIPRMTRDERRVAITGPIAVARGRVAEPLVSRLLNDVGDSPDQLPILQHALMRTWDYWKQHRRDGEPIDLRHYEAIGTMSDALSRHADEAWDELPDDRSRHIAEKMFRALTEKGADNRETRRPTRLREIAESAGASEAEVVAVIDTFRRAGRSFLMPPADVELTGEVVIDISHESLIRNWKRLKEWVTDEAQSARIYRRLAEAAVLHREGREGLVQDPALEIALEWRERSRPNAAWGRRYHPEFDLAVAYLEKSREARDAELAERERRRQEEIERERREREQAERFAAQQARAASRMRRLTFAMILLALLSAGTAAYALTVRARAVRARDEVRAALDVAKRSTEEAEAARGEAVSSLKELQRIQGELEAQKREAELNAESAVRAKEQAQVALKRAETEAARANEQAAIADRNLEKAEAARQQVLAAVERGKLIREGLEAYRREEFAEARGHFQNLRAALEALQPGASAARGAAAPQAEEARSYAEDLGWTLSNIGATFEKTASFSEAREYYEKARGVLERTLPADSAKPILFDTYHGLAHSYHILAKEGRPGQIDPKEGFKKAEDFFGRALTFQQRHNTKKPSETAAGHLRLARLYVDSGQFGAAEKEFKSAVEIRRLGKPSRELDTHERAKLVAALRDLAEFYQGQAGRYEDALRVFNEMIVVQEDIFVSEFLDQGQGLANSYSDLGQMYATRSARVRREAERLDPEKDAKEKEAKEKEASADARHAADALRTANLLQRTALRLRQLGKIQDAEDTPIIEGLTADLDELGDAYVKLGKLSDAEAIYETSLDYREGTPARFDSYHKLATFYLEHRKEYAKAEEFKQRLAEAYKSDPQLAVRYAASLKQLADTYSKDPEKFSEAESAYARALDIYAKQEDWANENNVLYALDELYRKQRKTAEREQVVQRRLETMTKYFKRLAGPAASRPKGNPLLVVSEYLNAVERAGLIYGRNQKYAEAEAAFRQASEQFEIIMGTYASLKVLTGYGSTLERYQALLARQDKKAAAEEVATKARAVREKERQLVQSEALLKYESDKKTQQAQSATP